MSAETLRAKIREIPDFPKPGILFYDITTLLKDPAAYREAIELIERLNGEVVGLAFLVELEFLNGRERLEGRKVTSVVKY